MLDFFKTMGQGILYTILLPFLIIWVLVYAVYCVFAFFFMFIKRIVMFFKGEDMTTEMKIDRVAKMHLTNQEEEFENKEKEVAQTSTPERKKPMTVVKNFGIIISSMNNM